MAFWIDASAEQAHEAAPHPASRASARPSSTRSASHSATYSASPNRRPPPSPFAQALSGYSPPMSPYKKPRSPFLSIKAPSVRLQPDTQSRVQALKDAEGRTAPVRNRTVHGAHANFIKRPLSATTPMSPKYPPPVHLQRPALNSRPSVDNTSSKSPQVKAPAHHNIDNKSADPLNRDTGATATKNGKRQQSDPKEKSRTQGTSREARRWEKSASGARTARTQLSDSPKPQTTPVPAKAVLPSKLPESKGLAKAKTAPRKDTPSPKGTASPRRSHTQR